MSACYRSNHPDVVAKWDDSQRRYREVHEAISAFVKTYGGEALVYKGGDYRLAALYSTDAPKGGEDVWRYDRKAGGWVPRRTTKGGKAIAKEMDACRAMNLGGVPGLPRYVHVKGGPGIFNMQGAAIFGHDGYVYAGWTSVDHEDVVSSEWGDLDEEMWEQVKRSEFYAADEARKEVSA